MTNVKCIEPNLAMLLEDGELKFFNLIWGGWQDFEEALEDGIDFFTNFLLRRDTDGSIIPPSYPTEIELRTQIQSLEYDGVYFWSAQAMNDTPYYPGWSLYQWEISDTTYALSRKSFKLFPGFHTVKAIALEWYRMPLGQSVGAGDNKILVPYDRKFMTDRLLKGQEVRIGPNTNGYYFWGTIKDVYLWPNDPNLDPALYHGIYIEFEETFPSGPEGSFTADGLPGVDLTPYSVFVETRVWALDSNSTLYEINPASLEVISSTYSCLFSDVSSLAFTYFKGISSVNSLQLTQALVYIKGMSMYYLDVTKEFGNRIEEQPEFTYMMDDTGGIYTENLYGSENNIIEAQSLYLHYYDGGNSFIPVYELRFRNDDPEEYFGDSHPQIYMLQRQYRGDRNSSVSTYADDTYNYFLKSDSSLPKMENQPTFLILTVEPQKIVSNVSSYTSAQESWIENNVPGGLASLEDDEIVYCKVRILDDYRFPVSTVGIPNPPYWKYVDIDWSATGGVGDFLDGDTTQTNASGISYNRFQRSSSSMPFPAYITASTDDIDP